MVELYGITKADLHKFREEPVWKAIQSFCSESERSLINGLASPEDSRFRDGQLFTLKSFEDILNIMEEIITEEEENGRGKDSTEY